MTAFRPASASLLAVLSLSLGAHAAGIQTDIRYLSGKGPATAVPWDFKVSDGRRSGAWSTIPVPSNWEQHGFGGYDYGESEKQHAERGQYRTTFAIPKAWQGRKIKLVFEGVMTETTVKINGVVAGPTHVGGFYRFTYDITSLIKPGAGNVLEVDVAKRATDKLTDVAEGKGDYWTFGGIFRPVWLEAAPAASIEHTAIDAKADGTLNANVRLDGAPDGAMLEVQILGANDKPVGQPVLVAAAANALTVAATLPTPKLWTAETPNLYKLRLTLRQGTQALHTTTTRFGFRTFEARAGDGLYLNGKKIIVKGVNRHSFRPATARALDPEDNLADARLIKSMNMNTARMSHYPPDPAFLDAADELGLYVIDELSGWQKAHGTEIGRKLVPEMVNRDVNHPSILFWANGNEGGWNRELDNDYALYDPQKRPVLHPWELHGGVDTKHYPNYELLTKRLQGPNLFMPTEFLHGLFDGGAGAGLDDYWKAMMASPYGAGGVIWVLADEGIERTDRNKRIDAFGTYAPDGIVGPRHEKEGSYYAVRRIWSPVQIDTPTLDSQFSGKLNVHNHYDFTPLSDVRFSWKLVRYPAPGTKESKHQILATGNAAPASVAARAKGELDLKLPPDWRDKQADAIEVTAVGADKQPLWTWSFATPALAQRLADTPPPGEAPTIDVTTGQLSLVAGKVRASFNPATGALIRLQDGDRVAALSNGPRLTYARPADGVEVAWLPTASAEEGVYRLASAQQASIIEVEPAFDKSVAYASFKLEISADGVRWKTVFDGAKRAVDGKGYPFPPQQVAAVRLSGIVDANGKPVALKSWRIGHAAARFPDARVTGNGIEGGTTGATSWVESRTSGGLKFRWTMARDGALTLDYSYPLDGPVQYHGVTFDLPESDIASMRWLGEGPFRVWQNRLHGTWLGVHETRYDAQQPGLEWRYPEFQGFYAGVRWARLETRSGGLTVSANGQDGYLRVGTPRVSHVHTTVEFPAGDLSYLHAIPAIGSKFIPSQQLGPSARWATAKGDYKGSLTFRMR